MVNINKVPSKIIEIETSIKLLEYLKRKSVIDDGMYNFCINRLMNKIELEKNRIDDEYINDLNNYKLYRLYPKEYKELISIFEKLTFIEKKDILAELFLTLEHDELLPDNIDGYEIAKRIINY